VVKGDHIVPVGVHQGRIVRLDLRLGVAERVTRVEVPEDATLVACANGRE